MTVSDDVHFKHLALTARHKVFFSQVLRASDQCEKNVDRMWWMAIAVNWLIDVDQASDTVLSRGIQL